MIESLISKNKKKNFVLRAVCAKWCKQKILFIIHSYSLQWNVLSLSHSLGEIKIKWRRIYAMRLHENFKFYSILLIWTKKSYRKCWRFFFFFASSITWITSNCKSVRQNNSFDLFMENEIRRKRFYFALVFSLSLSF